MQTTHSRLHPLLTAAAISLSVFSAVGVGTLTGLVPQSSGSSKEVIELPRELAKSVEPAITHPAPRQKPAARPVKPRQAEPVVYREFAEEPRLAQVQTPEPAVVKPGQVGTIQAVREVKDAGQHTALGPIAGGVVGAVLGAAGGAYTGREIEKQARATKHWEIDVRRDDGAYETVRSEVAPNLQPGERVRVVDGRLQPL